jgi:crossover junction endodeoxyribonuclease RuvC
MRVLGVDPGSRVLGWGVVEQVGTRLRHVAHGTIKVTGNELADRLVQLDQGLRAVIEEHAPASSAVEAMFFAKNAQSAATLGHARGVVLLALRRADLSIHEYPPAQVKRAVAGSGRADKRQVAMIVRGMLTLDDTPPSDAADALAVAITHLNRARFDSALLAR